MRNRKKLKEAQEEFLRSLPDTEPYERPINAYLDPPNEPEPHVEITRKDGRENPCVFYSISASEGVINQPLCLCPRCKTVSLPRVVLRPGSKTWIWSGFLCIFLFPLIFIPFTTAGCKDKKLECPLCGFVYEADKDVIQNILHVYGKEKKYKLLRPNYI